MKKLSRLRAIKWRRVRGESGPKALARSIAKKVIPEDLVGEKGFQRVAKQGTGNGNLVHYTSRYSYAQESTPATSFGEGIRWGFEGDHHFLIPVGYEEIIERIYGKNWREPVVSTHPTMVFWRD